MLRPLLLIVLLAAVGQGQAQAVRRKHLVMSVGGGIGVINAFSDRKDIEVVGLGSGVFRAAFGFAVTDRWSLGLHFDRVGSTWHNGALDRLHFTTYLFGIAYRPWITERSAMELEFGFGPMRTSLFPNDTRLPYTTTGGAVSVGFRYIGMLSRTIGAFAAFDHAASSSNELLLEGGLVNPGGGRSRFQWNSPRVSFGMIVRF